MREARHKGHLGYYSTYVKSVDKSHWSRQKADQWLPGAGGRRKPGVTALVEGVPLGLVKVLWDR